jgi:TRAP transporter 4TM/12TM fusion protein
MAVARHVDVKVLPSMAEDDGKIPSGNGVLQVTTRIIAGAFALFHVYTGFFGILPGMDQRIVHLAFALVLVFIAAAAGRVGNARIWAAGDIALAGVALGAMVYAYRESTAAMSERAGITTTADIVAGAVVVVVVLEATRRLMGWGLPLIALGFLIYAAFGQLFPGLLAHRGYDVERIVQQLFLSDEGLFGLPLGVSANYILLFILFGAVLRATGGGQFFFDAAYALCGWARGGPAKMAVTASALFGTMSGSAVANAATTGAFTIPLMRRVGFSPTTAAAIESVASCGGQIMPPVMGAAAFLVAEVLGVPYIHIAAAAAIPAVLYFLSLFVMVDFEAARLGIAGLRRAGLPAFGNVLRRGWHLLAPVAVLLYLLAVQDRSPMLAATWAIIAAIVVSALRAHTRIGPARLMTAMQQGAMGALEVAVACACAGIVIGVFTLTGLGIKFSALLIDLAGGQLFSLLVLTMIASLLLGTGLPTVPTYILLAVLVGPALIHMGVPPLAAHLFLFYFGVVSDMTPPLAISAYVAAGIAGAHPLHTTFVATRFGIAAYLIPFMFVYDPALILAGSTSQIVVGVLIASAGVVVLAAALQGYLFGPLALTERGCLLGASVLVIFPEIWTTVAGLAVAVAVLAFQALRRHRHEALAKS